MPSEYHSGDKVMTIDPVKLRFHMNIQNEDLAEATRRYASLHFWYSDEFHILETGSYL